VLCDDFIERYNALKAKHMGMLSLYPGFEFNLDEYEAKWMQAVQDLKRFPFIDSEFEVNRYIDNGTPILAEGAQGSLLDIDFGSYPFVTSSNTLASGACTGLGVAPGKIGKVYGIFKAYCTRVGSGPFPTELFDDMGEYLRREGHEFGATTGRPRRCGWLDMVALKYAVMMNGVTELIMMKSDILNSLDTIKVAVAYKRDGQTLDSYPYDGGVGVEPVYDEIKGWKSDICGIRDYDKLPSEFKDYVKYIEEHTGCPVTIISVGPDRDAIIRR
ncbi:MAG: adenylosuccinate synthetase, partial [Bacteroidales bacterium]|nr:adenylosuccinate synthetase [Bacteroidales bacterium]